MWLAIQEGVHAQHEPPNMGYTPNMGLKYTHTAIHSIKAKQLCATLINSIALQPLTSYCILTSSTFIA